ncbi:DNA cytosine methyltransferase [Agrobacterium genomosp. 2]|uniref:DNA (cytosine-5-)-methyltransferase n=1 Tax=Agrobacterium genomosp. 2 str. CFBP 5494 TaxID=1183436 RepID=A0A9W5B2P1_9HYPH|nr:DNA cytosine methyltransferase [Agrobacterium genomosp. 2]CUW93665.1 putative DNA (cytosine-5-)-methyltransferase [Agrobacterium genomosp. 2 str. CFBP 5494]
MKAFEIYSGVGGMGIGFEAAGIQVSGGVDAWDRVGYVRAANGLEYNWADASDLTEFGTQLDRNKVDIVIGGPPCQDFSKGGKRRPGQNAAYTRSYALLIATARPEWFVYENVTEAAESREYYDARRIWLDSGYGLTELFLDASRYGVPQERWRLITIGRRGEAYQFLEDPIRKLASKEQRTVRSILDPRDPDDARLLEIGYYYTRAFSSGAGVFSIDEPTNGINKSFRQKPYGIHKTRENPKDAIRATDAHVLTQQQMARLQGFPRNFKWPISSGKLAVGDIDQMVANAMPPAFAYHIAKAIRERHEGKVSKVNRDFGACLRETRKDLNERTIDNICGRVNRGRILLGGRTYSDAYIEAAELERVFDDIYKAWKENQRLPKDQRDPNVQEPFDTTAKSDMRVALRMYAERPREKSEVEVAIAKGEAKRKREPKRPSLFPRYPAKWLAKWTIEDLLHSPVPTRATKKRLLTPRVPPKTVEEAYLADKAAQDFDPYPDDYHLSPPALDTDENWRPEDYDDPMQDTEYLEHLESLKDDD